MKTLLDISKAGHFLKKILKVEIISLSENNGHKYTLSLYGDP